MRCPHCRNPDNTVLESRQVHELVRRRRKCMKCKHRWTTYERCAGREPLVDVLLKEHDGMVMVHGDRFLQWSYQYWIVWVEVRVGIIEKPIREIVYRGGSLDDALAVLRGAEVVQEAEVS
ncbi:NrdR family transcriptional regulator [Pantanalinema sp. GBBB05]|uniref:NrdR family transcriptional regulator n=1 Tax=Pantanalinema sp. GBBB05 TaxID=2604139 RepID=UPI001D2285C8|nr:hypothetical protein [Pantanalinema sp. GBBB05]